MVVSGDVYYGLVSNKVDVGLRGWATYFASEAINVNLEASTPPSKLQFVIEPSLRGSFGPVRVGFGFLLPVGGRIGADQHVRSGAAHSRLRILKGTRRTGLASKKC